MNEPPTTGRILAQTFSVFSGNFVTFFGVCAIVLSPLIVLQAYVTLTNPAMTDFTGAMDPAEVGFGAGGFGVILLMYLLQLTLPHIATAATSYGVFQQVRGKRAGIGECLAVGLRRFPVVLGVSILIGIATLFGAVLCIVPGIIAYVFLAMAIPAAVIERTGVIDSLSRSTSLGEGYRWVVFGVLFGLLLLVGVAGALVGLAAMLVSPIAYIVVVAVFTVLWTAIQATGVTLVYYNLRAAKESFDIEEIAEIFA